MINNLIFCYVMLCYLSSIFVLQMTYNIITILWKLLLHCINKIRSLSIMSYYHKCTQHSIYATQINRLNNKLRMLDMNCYDRITHTQKSLNFLVVGPKGSGKKSLLQYSCINLYPFIDVLYYISFNTLKPYILLFWLRFISYF